MIVLPKPLPPRRLALRVTRDAQRALRAGHPWLYDRSITSQSASGAPGDLAVIFDDHRRFLAVGLYDPASPLRVRVLQHDQPAPIDAAFLAQRLAAAAQRRAPLLAASPPTDGYRLVYGEGDGLPGLVIDRYDRILVIKLYSAAWIPWLHGLLPALAEQQPAQWVVLRLSRTVQAQPHALLGLADGVTLAGAPPPEPWTFNENDLRFEVDVLRGQKTGFFLDQRDNRARVETLAAGRSTLNVFAYTGGFSLYAARGGAPVVTSLDLSAPALAAAVRNFSLNRHLPAVAAAQHDIIVADAFAGLKQLAAAGQRFGLVVVDPPAFAKQQSEIPAALRAYERLARLAAGVVQPRGQLVMASCSSRVSAPEFYAAVRRGAAAAGRTFHEFDHTEHPLDHPSPFPEGAYLKCLYAEVT